jgi:hypothetical protein
LLILGVIRAFSHRHVRAFDGDARNPAFEASCEMPLKPLFSSSINAQHERSTMREDL